MTDAQIIALSIAGVALLVSGGLMGYLVGWYSNRAAHRRLLRESYDELLLSMAGKLDDAEVNVIYRAALAVGAVIMGERK